MPGSTKDSDPHLLQRFIDAQQADYENVLDELRNGHKQSHWMWYIFPQFDGLGLSPTSKRYSLKSVEEAKAYLSHPILVPRILECSELLLRHRDRTANEILGSPDDMKLRSCATLFANISPAGSIFDRLLDTFFGGTMDNKTLHLLKS